MKILIAAVLAVGVVLLALGGGIYVGVVRPLITPAEETPRAEAALLTPDVVLVAGVNVKQVAFLERWFLGTPVVTASHDATARAVADRTLSEHLRAVAVDPRRDLDYALYALYPAGEAAIRHAIVLVGRFDPTAITGYLTRELHASAHAAAGGAAYEIAMIDPMNCRPRSTWMVTVTPRWILLADPTSHARLLPRLTGGPVADEPVVAWWRSLARADVLSAGVWNLRDADKAAPQGFLNSMTKTAMGQAEPFQRVYAGVGAKTVPPQGRLRLVLDATDAARGAGKLRSWQQSVSEAKGRWAAAMPTIAALYDSLALRSEGARSTIEFTVDRTLAGNLRRAANEIVSGILGGFGVRVSPRESGPRPERIDTDEAPFQDTAPTTLAAYDPAAQFADDVDQTAGPFGVRLEALRLRADPEGGLEAVVEAFAGAIPNVSGEQPRARLFVDSVKSKSRQELVKPEPCGRERNSEPAPFTASFRDRLKATKTVRLRPGSDPHGLASVSGRVQLRLPTRAEALGATHPAPGTVFAKGGAIFTLISLDGGRLSYQITGAREDILHVRALNAAGRPLASEGKFSADFLLGDGLSGQTEYAGVVDRVEVVFAVAEQVLEFPFTLTDLSLTGKPRGVAVDGTPPFRPYSHAALRREPPVSSTPDSALAHVPLPPFELSLDKVQSFFDTRLEFTLRSPAAPNFERGFGVGRLRLTRVELTDGSTRQPAAPSEAARPPAAAPPTWSTPVRFGASAKDGALATKLYVSIGRDVKPEALKTIRGALTIQLPTTLERLRLDDLSPGQHAERGDLRVTVLGRARSGLTLGTNKDGERIVDVRLMNAEGHAVAFMGPQITESADGAWRFELSPRGPVVSADVSIARRLERRDFPFVLQLIRP